MDEEKQNVITIDDIAKKLGVSKTTVSRSISGKGRIGKETRERVLQFIKEHDYKPNILAKGLAQNRTYNIGLAMPEDLAIGDLPFFQQCTNGICQIAADNDYDVILFRTNGTDLAQLKRIVNNHKADGIILTRTLVDDYFIRMLKQKGMPFVTIGSSKDADVTHADNDHAHACKTLAEFLLNKGITKFALIGGNLAYYVNTSRLSGFQSAVAEYSGKIICKEYLNLQRDPQIIKAVDDALNDGVDCIVCMDDYICLRVISRLAELSVQIPDEVSVATFYSSILIENNNPVITGLEFNAFDLGGIACQMLIDKLNGETVNDFMSTDYRLIVGKSIR